MARCIKLVPGCQLRFNTVVLRNEAYAKYCSEAYREWEGAIATGAPAISYRSTSTDMPDKCTGDLQTYFGRSCADLSP